MIEWEYSKFEITIMQPLDEVTAYIVSRPLGPVNTKQVLSEKIEGLGGRVVQRFGKEVTHVIFQRLRAVVAEEQIAEDSVLLDLYDKASKVLLHCTRHTRSFDSPVSSLDLAIVARHSSFSRIVPSSCAHWFSHHCPPNGAVGKLNIPSILIFRHHVMQHCYVTATVSEGSAFSTALAADRSIETAKLIREYICGICTDSASSKPDFHAAGVPCLLCITIMGGILCCWGSPCFGKLSHSHAQLLSRAIWEEGPLLPVLPRLFERLDLLYSAFACNSSSLEVNMLCRRGHLLFISQDPYYFSIQILGRQAVGQVGTGPCLLKNRYNQSSKRGHASLHLS